MGSRGLRSEARWSNEAGRWPRVFSLVRGAHSRRLSKEEGAGLTSTPSQSRGACKQRHVDPDLGDAPTPLSHRDRIAWGWQAELRDGG